ncbi:MAG TPA: polyprenyl synthetase family protein [Candidatus Paceibacterota bacterium]|jgi:farnesyl diphosphate synthase|nr:polyprenyl synthetase family protein [Candidatus Paceibacterota bacterium]
MKIAAVPMIEVGLFEKRLAETTELLEPKLEELLPHDGRLAEAMRYAVLGAGKRFRPLLVLESAELFAAPKNAALQVAAAIECLHCYSLAHDDLPAMDDDDMRRGKPTVHKKFGEATAILAGDALQSLAFELLAGDETHPDLGVRTELILGLAQAAGSNGMAGGQELDLETTPDVEQMSAMKTGALIRFSVVSGAILGKAAHQEKTALGMYGSELGLAFQISDDLLDVGKDAAAQKKTFVTAYGVARAREKLRSAVQNATQALDVFGPRGQQLRDAAQFMVHRVQ